MNVLLVGLDGLGGHYMEADVSDTRARMPTLCQMMGEALVATTAARTVFPPISAPAWVAAISGMGPDCTGIVDNNWDAAHCVHPVAVRPGTTTPWTLYDSIAGAMAANPAHSPTTTGIGGVHTSLVASWSWLTRLVDTSVCTHVLDAAGDDHRAVAMYEASCTGDDGTMPHRLSFVHLDAIDGAGHTHTWGSEAYRSAWSVADAQLAQLKETATRHAYRTNRQLVVVVVSDHGGSGQRHGDIHPTHMKVPLVVWECPPQVGDGDASHHCSGGGARWQMMSAQQPPSILDVAPTVLTLMGLPVPPWMKGNVLVCPSSVQ